MDSCPFGPLAFTSSGDVVQMPCNLWSCPICSKHIAYRWSLDIRYGLALWKPRPSYFWTLTLPGWVNNPADGYKMLPKKWDAVRKAMQRHQGTWHYAAFVEGHPHRSFIPHFHIISLAKPPYRLKDFAVHCGFGFEAKEIEIDGPHAANYVSKYASKQGTDMPRGFRRVRVSSTWPRLPDPQTSEILYVMGRAETLTDFLARVSDVVGLAYLRLRTAYKQADVERKSARMAFLSKAEHEAVETHED